MNDKSSRSHSVFTIVLAQTKTEMWEGHEHDHSITSKINLVDLAGSERQSQAMTSGERLREGANINKSLLTLGKVISLLSEQSAQNGKKKKTYIPYRDSVLTWLLKESLGGNSKTTMIATISPANSHIEETLSTLRYAKQARSIVNVARVNEDPKAKLIRELRAEIEHLRLQTGNINSEEAQTGTLAEIVCLRDQLKAREKEMEEMTRSWQERLKQSEERKLEESKLLEKAGITFKVDNKLPNLVNLNEDPQLSEMLLYVLKEGITRVGRMGLNSKHDIQLNGALIAENHCIINNVDLVVNITPIGDAPIYINGNLILEPTILHHGDRVILGGDHYFRFNHPIEVQKNKTESHAGPQEIRDFEFAKQELLRVQESRLQKELEEARRKAQEELQQELERTRKMAEVELLSQKSDYDHKLSELEKVLKEQAEEKEQAEQSRQEAQGLVEKLRKQKMMLEQEVLAGRKRQQLEAEAAQKVALQTAVERSRILELLEAERQNAELKLEELRQRRNELMSSATRQPMVAEIPVGKKDLYKIALQLREANKISQYLKKHTIFSREDFLEGDQVRTTIKVTNTKLNVTTHWTLVKFEEKLVQMRDLFQNEGENSSDDEVFTDPKDDWKNNSMSSPGTSPNLRNGHRYSSPGLQLSLLSSLSSSGNSPQKSTNGLAESIADKVLIATETLWKAVLYLKEKMGTTEDNNNMKDKLDPVKYSTVQMYSVQMITCLNCLANHSVAWSAMYRSLNSTLIRDLIHRMTEQIRSMGGQLVHFLQACENSIDSLLDESSYKIWDCLQIMCKLTGELALATDTQMWCFEDMGNQEGTKEGDNNFGVGPELCQSFFSGCEVFIDKTLQGALKTVEDYEIKAQSFTDLAADTLQLGDVPQNIEIVVSTCRVLLQKCQELQVEVDTSLQEGSLAQPAQLCGAHYKRSQALISHISSLVESVGLLIQTSEPVIEGKDNEVRKICKCADMIQKGAMRLTAVSGRDLQKIHRSLCESSSLGTGKQKPASRSSNDSSSGKDSQNNSPSVSILSDSQVEQLEFACHEVHLSIASLIESVHKFLKSEKAKVLMSSALSKAGEEKRLLSTPDKGRKFRTSQESI
ncbi:hypothetical protein CHS0354_017768 [Potamilus streckersoni]|uniref:Kinesin motor domain-containing protein n=1 Tax=Potamilus streckersoni TaxID=2493646 RepID=A0AAE0W9A9_9BIVA|nr:hypothetical protein CHS0354_017768 [Potamilus streckersoni]